MTWDAGDDLSIPAQQQLERQRPMRWYDVVVVAAALAFFLAWNDVQFPGSDALRAMIRAVASMVPN